MNQTDDKSIMDPETRRAVAEIEKGAITFNEVMTIAIRNTVSEDWVDFGGKAWLSAPASERIARALGLSVKEWSWEREDQRDDKGPFYVITCQGWIGHKPSDMWTPAIGIQWSRKPFFFKDGNRERHVSEIHPGNIIKDAYSDMYRNGVTRFLGLRGLSWRVLAEHGIEQTKTTRVDFKTKKAPPKQGKKKATTDEPVYADAGAKNLLAKSAARKVIGSDQESILSTIPEKLEIPALNTLMRQVMELEAEIEPDQWADMVKAAQK